MNYKELLFNKDKALTFFPELAVVLNEYDKYLVKIGHEVNGKKWKSKQCGLNVAIVINQINYWNELNEKLESKKHFKDGYYWTYHAYDKWAKEDFPFWSGDTVRRAIKFLEDIGLVISTDEYNTWKADNTKWYRIDYDKLQEIINTVEKLREDRKSDEKEDESENEKQVAETVNADCGSVLASCTDGLGIEHKPIPEITTENTNIDYISENTSNSFSKEKDLQSNSPEGERSNSFSREKKTAAPKPNKKHSEKEMEDMVNQMPLRAKRIAYELTNDISVANNTCNFFKYFLENRKGRIAERHRVLSNDTLEQLITTITNTIPIEREGGYMDFYDPLISWEQGNTDYESIVDEYFKTDFKEKCDYSIVHFTRESVLTNMMNHVDKCGWCQSEPIN